MNVQDMLMTVSFVVLVVFILIAVGLFGYDQIQEHLQRKDEQMFCDEMARLVAFFPIEDEAGCEN